ncbi:hypothetical protein [Natronorubrum tibetense]|uniref:hypothetical protein n=1 Tax=Natronorubrum tibetense TaxID=63128 RepID=UPI001F4CADCC|nr:hypothetical protein [Natronorubrum tibetense]
MTVTVLLTFSYSYMLIQRDYVHPLDVGAFVVLVLLIPCVIGWLLVRSHPTPYDPEEGCIVYVSALTEIGRPGGHSSSTNEFDPYSLQSMLIYTYLAGLVLTAIAFFTGGIMSLLFLLYPLLEVTVLIFGVLSVVRSRLSIPVRTVHADVETVFLKSASAVIVSPKGFATFFFIFGGLAMAGISLVAGVGILTLGGRVFLTEMATGTIGATVAVGLTCGVIYGIYGLWYWLGVARRLPALLRVSEGSSVSPIPIRPRGAMISPTMLLLYPAGVVVILALLIFHGLYDEISPLWLIGTIGVGFIVVLGLVTWNVLSTFRQSRPQPAASDDQAIPTAIVIQSIGFIASLVLLSVYDPITGGGIKAGIESLRSSVVVYGRWLLLLPPFLTLFYANRLGRMLFDSDNSRVEVVIMFAVTAVLIGLLVVVF